MSPKSPKIVKTSCWETCLAVVLACDLDAAEGGGGAAVTGVNIKSKAQLPFPRKLSVYKTPKFQTIESWALVLTNAVLQTLILVYALFMLGQEHKFNVSADSRKANNQLYLGGPAKNAVYYAPIGECMGGTRPSPENCIKKNAKWNQADCGYDWPNNSPMQSEEGCNNYGGSWKAFNRQYHPANMDYCFGEGVGYDYQCAMDMDIAWSFRNNQCRDFHYEEVVYAITDAGIDITTYHRVTHTRDDDTVDYINHFVPGIEHATLGAETGFDVVGAVSDEFVNTLPTGLGRMWRNALVENKTISRTDRKNYKELEMEDYTSVIISTLDGGKTGAHARYFTFLHQFEHVGQTKSWTDLPESVRAQWMGMTDCQDHGGNIAIDCFVGGSEGYYGYNHISGDLTLEKWLEAGGLKKGDNLPNGVHGIGAGKVAPAGRSVLDSGNAASISYCDCDTEEMEKYWVLDGPGGDPGYKKTDPQTQSDIATTTEIMKLPGVALCNNEEFSFDFDGDDFKKQCKDSPGICYCPAVDDDCLPSANRTKCESSDGTFIQGEYTARDPKQRAPDIRGGHQAYPFSPSCPSCARPAAPYRLTGFQLDIWTEITNGNFHSTCTGVCVWRGGIL
jgi:hypothetical protein